VDAKGKKIKTIKDKATDKNEEKETMRHEKKLTAV
jgi:hypothetical protein